MFLSAKDFLQLPEKRITLMGMSGVGKTHLAGKLMHEDWFHYAADYRIGTRYLAEPILDNIKEQMMQVPFLRDLLLTDSIYLNHNMTFQNLKPISSFLGKIGNPERGGLPWAEFKKRQQLHRQAEMNAMRDVPDFIEKSKHIYGYKHFINDASGSLCELDDEDTLSSLAKHTLIIYIQATPEDETRLITRAQLHPKPLYYREKFLEEQLGIYMKEYGLNYLALINPDDFVRWVFPKLFYARLPRYQSITNQYGYALPASQLLQLKNANDFVECIAHILSQDKRV